MSKALSDLVGPIGNTEIVENTCFESLRTDKAFIRREGILILEDGTNVPLGNPEYLEFLNSKAGREDLLQSGLDQKVIDATFVMWGDTPTIEDPVDPLKEQLTPTE